MTWLSYMSVNSGILVGDQLQITTIRRGLVPINCLASRLGGFRDGNGPVLGRGLVPPSPSPFKKTIPVPAKKIAGI